MTNCTDRELLRRFEAQDSLSEQDKAPAKEMFDLVILKNRLELNHRGSNL